MLVAAVVVLQWCYAQDLDVLRSNPNSIRIFTFSSSLSKQIGKCFSL